MRIIGLTGRSGSGKSTVAAYYRSLGYTVADGDLVARQVLGQGSPCLAKIQAVFGADLISEAGNLDRAGLAARAYASPEATQALVDITHPEIIRRLLEEADQAQNRGETLFFVDGAVIVGAPFEAYCSAVLLVSAPEEASLARICRRDGLALKAAKARLNAQLPLEQLRAACAFEIKNNGDEAWLLRQAEAALEFLKGGA